VKRAFVTGGSGFVGRNLIPALRARGVEVRALARSDSAMASVKQLGAEPVKGDLSGDGANVDAVHAGMQGCDVVFHAAAHVKEHGKLAEFELINVTGTKVMLGCARHAGVARFVHVGTEAVLADGKPIIRADETRPYPVHPVGPYPITKGAAERAVIAANADGFATIAIRPRFIWGKGDTSLLPQLLEAVRKKRFGWVGHGHYLTSTCHVANVIEGALLAAEKGAPANIYFLTDGDPVDFRDFLTRYIATQGVDAGKREVPRWLAKTTATLTAWMANPPVTKMTLALMGHEVTVVDAKARRELGYVGRTTIDAGLAEMSEQKAALA
jgi:nucleoside-diphosphate-sugar epimerase